MTTTLNNNTSSEQQQQPPSSSSASQFNTAEFFRMSLEQYLLLKSAYLKKQLDECAQSEQKRGMVEDFISEFITFAKQLMGRSSKTSLLLISEVIEKLFVMDFSLLRMKSAEELPRTTINRGLKTSILMLSRIDMHLIQLLTRLECVKLMYEFLMLAEKVPKGLNYRDKFESDLSRHLDQIKVAANMSPELFPLDNVFLTLFNRLLAACTCVEFYTFLNNFAIRNDLSKPIRKHLRAEYENLTAKYSKHQQGSMYISNNLVISNNNNTTINEYSNNSPRKPVQNQTRTPTIAASITGQHSMGMEVELDAVSKKFNQSQNSLHNLENSQFNLIQIKPCISANNNITPTSTNTNNNNDNKNTSTTTAKPPLATGFAELMQKQQDKKKINNTKTNEHVSAEEKDQNAPRQQQLTMSNNNNNNNTTNNKNTSGSSLQLQKGVSVTATAAARSLAQPIQSGRTMYSLLNKKVVRNSQSSTSSKQQAHGGKSHRSHSTKSITTTTAAAAATVSTPSSQSQTNNILFQAASKLLMEQQLDSNKRQSQLKLMSRESSKLSEKGDISIIEKNQIQASSTVAVVAEGDEENSIPLMYMWGHHN